jgi:dephospho-CoA kinase
MKRVLITGMSGTGKSTLIAEIAARGFKAVDADWPGWSEYRGVPRHTAGETEQEWVWREDRIAELLSDEDVDLMFLSGCASNQGKFYPLFDHIVLLTAPSSLLVERLANRTTNDFGKDPEELARVLEDLRTVEPLLRRRATLEVDTSAPLDDVLATVLQHVA